MEDFWFFILLFCIIAIGIRLSRLEESKLSKKELAKLREKQKEQQKQTMKIAWWVLVMVVLLIITFLMWAL
jgi:hypothetical protein